MPEHPHPNIWERLRAHVDADPTPGEQRLAGAVQHAQAEDHVFDAHLHCLTCGWPAPVAESVDDLQQMFDDSEDFGRPA